MEQESPNMSEVALRFRDELLRLPEEDRVALAHLLWDSIEEPPDDVVEDETTWIAELDRRSADYAAGRTTAEPYREVIEELRQEGMRESSSQ
jgi:putative addiction module component (TIGR02574 family)